MPNGNDLGDSIEGDPDAMSTGIAFDVTKEFIKLQVSEIKFLEVGVPQGDLRHEHAWLGLQRV